MFKKFIISIALLIMSAGAMATDYSYFKSQPLTIVIPYGPGGNTDIIGRLLASRITSQTGIKTVVLNKPGGAGIIGSNYVVQAPADGFTIMYSNSLPLLNSLIPLPGAPDMNQFDFVIPTLESPHVIVVSAKSGIRNYKDFVKRLNGAENFSATFPMVKIWVKNIAEQEHVQAPEQIIYKSQAEALTAVLKGEVMFSIAGIADTNKLIESGELVAIATATNQRIPLIPSVPTLQELGIKNSLYSGYFGVYAPVGIPADVRVKLNMLFQDALWDAHTVSVLHNRGLIPIGGDLKRAEQHRKFLIEFHKKDIAKNPGLFK